MLQWPRYPGRQSDPPGVPILPWLRHSKANPPMNTSTARAAHPEMRFVPAATRAVDLDPPLADMDLGPGPSGSGYGSLVALVRLHESPLSTVEAPLNEGRISAEALAGLIWAELETEIRTHVAEHGCAR
jgi:hypothetical protein